MRNPIHLSYIICTTVRSGSWMLCSALRQTGVAGHPSEFFGQTLGEEILNNRNVNKLENIESFMDRMVEVSTTPNGVFGTKLPANHVGMFLRRASEHNGRKFASLREAFETEFPNLHYVHLHRENKVAQAISLYRAVMTGLWRRIAGDASASQRPEPEYDHFAIQRCYQDIVLSDRYWEGFFGYHGITPIRLSYDEMASNYDPTIRRLLASLGLPWHMDVPTPRTSKLADERSLAWEAEFKRHGELPKPEIGWSPETFWAPY